MVTMHLGERGQLAIDHDPLSIVAVEKLE